MLIVFVTLGVGIYYHANLFPDHQTIWGGDWTEWRIFRVGVGRNGALSGEGLDSVCRHWGVPSLVESVVGQLSYRYV